MFEKIRLFIDIQKAKIKLKIFLARYKKKKKNGEFVGYKADHFNDVY